ncbi:putative nitronate monooxygenase [Clavispora lusitaniae]|uniref:Nitronate monooxygenase n=1 Tax=Clavispora lusitaniae TaxID=36911 RepID=A0AA91Q4A6_CLALS|nr:putative nitronate monooxygenase [Clavispora lusitaniae]
MAGISNVAVASEVARAGALGSLPLSTIDLTKSVEPVFSQIEEFRHHAPAAPVNLNFFCFDPAEQQPVSDAARENWRRIFAVDSTESHDWTARAVVSFREFEEKCPQELNSLVRRLVSARAQVVSFHFGAPAPSTIAALQEGGIMVLATATSVKEAQYLIDAGVDALVCQGFEAGGHRGNFLASDAEDECLSTHALFLQVVALKKGLQNASAENSQSNSSEFVAVNKKPARDPSDVYVIPAGGIVDSATATWYLAHGAAAVQMGTVFLPVAETSAPPFIGDCITERRGVPTVMTCNVSGRSARALATPFIKDIQRARDEHPQPFPSFGYATSAYRKLAAGPPENGFYLAGQNYHLVEVGLGAKEIVERIGKALAFSTGQ